MSGKRFINKPLTNLLMPYHRHNVWRISTPNKDTYIRVDASPVGISAILSQKTKEKDDDEVISYASPALTAVERRYSQTEKEALAIVWGVEHFTCTCMAQNLHS